MAILTMFRHRFYKNDGSLNSGGKVWTYVAGTSTPVATYTSSDASTPNTNPIILNSKGECDLWVTGTIKVNVLESDDTQVTGWPVDNIGSGVANNDATMRWAGTAGGTANALTITPSPAIGAYVIGQSFIFKAGASPNSAATTIAISGLSAIVAQLSGSALAGGEILAGKWYSIVLDSLTTCQITPIASAALTGSASQAFSTAALTAAGLLNISGAAAGQIKFPATQNASADANTLDDYDEYTAASAACTGAITPSVVWKLVKVGKMVVLALPDTTGAGSAQTNFVYGTVIPAKYRPTGTNINQLTSIVDNSVTLANPGEIVVGANGVITVYKEPTGTTNFTATGNAGIASRSVSWMI